MSKINDHQEGFFLENFHSSRRRDYVFESVEDGLVFNTEVFGDSEGGEGIVDVKFADSV